MVMPVKRCDLRLELVEYYHSGTDILRVSQNRACLKQMGARSFWFYCLPRSLRLPNFGIGQDYDGYGVDDPSNASA